MSHKITQNRSRSHKVIQGQSRWSGAGSLEGLWVGGEAVLRCWSTRLIHRLVVVVLAEVVDRVTHDDVVSVLDDIPPVVSSRYARQQHGHNTRDA